MPDIPFNNISSMRTKTFNILFLAVFPSPRRVSGI